MDLRRLKGIGMANDVGNQTTPLNQVVRLSSASRVSCGWGEIA
jgi:hypothetical protein